MRQLPLRVRLVAGFATAMLVLLTAAGAFVYWRVEYALDRQLDTDLTEAAGVVAPLVGEDGIVTSTDTAAATGAAWQVLNADGHVLDSGGPAPNEPLVTRDQLETVDGPRTFELGSLLPAADAPYRVRVSRVGDRTYLLVGVRRDHRDEALRELLGQLSAAGAIALVISSLVGYLLARLALAPVERYRRRADEIAEVGTPHLRLDVPADRDDEVTRLGHTLNEMLDALGASLDRERRFVDDASHELRTPLTLLKSRIQMTGRRSRSVAEHEQVLDELAVDVARLTDLAEHLLDLGRDPGAVDHTADAVRVVQGVVERWRTARPERAGDVSLSTPTEAVAVRIEARALERVVSNLLDNALLHGSPPVELVVRREAGDAVLEVSDSGEGMSPGLLAEATRRFSRAPEARARPGAGLGLSIVEHLVTVAGGELTLTSEEGAGLRVRVRLPTPTA